MVKSVGLAGPAAAMIEQMGYSFADVLARDVSVAPLAQAISAQALPSARFVWLVGWSWDRGGW